MSRAFIIMLDSFGIGATEDAINYGDQGADTLGHIIDHCQTGRANKSGVRQGPLNIPNLSRLGIHGAAAISHGQAIDFNSTQQTIQGLYGCAKEISMGKDTQSGHWELAGLPVLFDWGYFSPQEKSFPTDLLETFIKQAQLSGVLGNKHASGTDIIAELGEIHQITGQPIVYTSADSVFQIAAHEESFGLDKLYEICEIARKLVDDYHIGRVIARPFIGTPGNYQRTGNRRDYATPPHQATLLDIAIKAGHEVIAIGKVADIYAHHGISKTIKANGNQALFSAFIEAAKEASDGSITFVNLVDFDMLYGHRRDIIGYANALEEFDSWLPTFEQQLKPGDMAIITADHGCDPTWPGSDHTREHVPILVFGPTIQSGPIGLRDSFADMGQSIAKHLGLPKLKYGKAFI